MGCSAKILLSITYRRYQNLRVQYFTGNHTLLFSHLFLRLPSDPFLLKVSAEMLYGYITFITSATDPAHISPLICSPWWYFVKHKMAILFIYGAGVESRPLLLWLFIGPLYQPWMIHNYDCGAISGMNEWQGKRKYLKKTCPSVNLHRLHMTWPELESGPPRWEAWGTARSNHKVIIT
jgi:hypothetical protein